MDHDNVTPYNSGKQKKEQVAEMFDHIATRYDLLNSVLSLGIHRGWRKKCVKILAARGPKRILDVTTGTGDFAIACCSIKPESIVGIDISEGMLKVGRDKIKSKGLANIITLETGNAENYAAPDNSFDAIVVGFGVRNFENLERGLQNLRRLLRPGGLLLVLEFSYPRSLVMKGLYGFYLKVLTPLVGRMVSKDPRAYSYLSESIRAFPHNDAFVKVMNASGFNESDYRPLSLGIVAIYTGVK